MGVVDLEQKEFRFLNAGHPPLIRINKETHTITVMDQKGSLPLGWMPGTKYDNNDIDHIALDPKDMYLLFTDGIYECTDPQGNQFGMEGLKQLLKDASMSDTCITLPFKILDYLEKNEYETASDDFSLFSFQVLKDPFAKANAQDLIKHHHIVLRSALKEVGKTAQECESLVLRWTGDSHLAAKVELIVDEFLNNIISYGYDYQEDSEIVLGFRFYPDMISIRFWDKGIEWIPQNLSYSITDPYDFELDGLHSSGRGVKIIMSMSNRFQRKRFGHLNETKVEIDL